MHHFENSIVTVCTCKLGALPLGTTNRCSILQETEDTRDSNGPFASDPDSTNGVLFHARVLMLCFWIH